MPAALQIKFGSTDFTTSATSWTETVPKRINPVSLAKVHGAKLSEQPPYDMRTVAIDVSVHGTTAEDARTNLDNIINAFPEEVDKLYKHDDRYLNAYFAGVDNLEFAEGSVGMVIQTTLRFICPDPFYYALTQTTSSTTATGTAASRTAAAAGANNNLTFTAREIGQLGNNIKVKMVSAGAESIVTATTDLNATRTLTPASGANGVLTFTSVGTGTDDENIRVNLDSGTVETIDVRAKDIRVTYNASTSTATTLKTLIDGVDRARELVSVAVGGTGAGVWALGDDIVTDGFVRLITGQKREITVNFNTGVSTATSLKAIVDADATANSWVSTAVEGTGAGTWVTSDQDADFVALSGGDPHSISINNTGGTVVFPKITFTPAGGNVSTLKIHNITNFPGRSFDFQATVTSAQKLIGDFPNFNVTNNGTKDLNNWKQADGTASDVIWLVSGTNTLDLEWTLPTTSAATSITVDVLYTRRWI